MNRNRKSRKETKRRESQNVRRVKKTFEKIKNFSMAILLLINTFAFLYVAFFMCAVEKGKQVITYIIVTALCFLAYKGLCKLERIVLKKMYRREKEIRFRKEYNLMTK